MIVGYAHKPSKYNNTSYMLDVHANVLNFFQNPLLSGLHYNNDIANITIHILYLVC